MLATIGSSGPPWWMWLVLALVAAVALCGDLYVYRDARARGLSRTQTVGWMAGCLFMWAIFFPLWFVMRGEYLHPARP